MTFKISGNLNLDSRVIVLNESDWSVESNTEESAGVYEIEVADNSNARSIICITDAWRLRGYGNVTPEEVGLNGWVQILDNTYWSSAKGVTWDGTKWSCPVNLVHLYPIGGWEVGARPTKLRVTYTSSLVFDISVIDTNSDTIASYAACPSTTEIDITFGSYNIYMLQLYYDGAATVEVYNIEFYF